MDDHAKTPDRDQRPEEYRASPGGGLRSDGVSGVILICLGFFAVFNGAFGFLMALMMYFVALPLMSQSTPPPAGFLQMQQSILLYLLVATPLMALLGLSFILCGFKIRRGSERARRLAQATVLAGLLWFAGCMLYSVLYAFPRFPKNAQSPIPDVVLQTITVVGNVGIAAVVVAFLLYILSRPKPTQTSPPDESE